MFSKVKYAVQHSIPCSSSCHNVRACRDCYLTGLAIAFLIQSVDRSLSTRLIVVELRRTEFKEIYEKQSHFATVHDSIQQPVFKQEFSGLKVVG